MDLKCVGNGFAWLIIYLYGAGAHAIRPSAVTNLAQLEQPSTSGRNRTKSQTGTATARLGSGLLSARSSSSGAGSSLASVQSWKHSHIAPKMADLKTSASASAQASAPAGLSVRGEIKPVFNKNPSFSLLKTIQTCQHVLLWLSLASLRLSSSNL